MNIKTLNVFAVIANSDTTEGKGHLFDLAYFEKEEDAYCASKDENVVRKFGVMGVGTLHYEERTLVIHGDLRSFLICVNLADQKKILGKLTESEKEILRKYFEEEREKEGKKS